MKLNLNGVYLPSFNEDFKHLGYNIKPNFIILGSAHNIREIRVKEAQNVNLIFISSLFKKNNNYLGLYKFKNLTKMTKKKVIALGGISKFNKKQKPSLINFLNNQGRFYFGQNRKKKIMD